MADYMGDVGGDQMAVTDPADLLGVIRQERGKKFIYARAGAALTHNTPYGLIHEGGTGATIATSDPVVKGLLSTAVYQLVCVPVFRSMDDDDTGWFQIQGMVTDMVMPSVDWTATYPLKVDGGALAVSASAVPSNGEKELGHIVKRASTGAVTKADVFLYGIRVLTET
jgi:hypothetical protein